MRAEEVLSLVFVGVFGAAIGSWLNVVILRLHADRPWWRGRSTCTHCGTALRWYELIPIFSFVLIRGRCRHCHQVLTWQYFIVEVLTALAFVVVWRNFGVSWLLPVGWALVSTMVLVGVFDARWALIPDGFSIAFNVVAIIAALLGARPVTDMMLGGLAGGAVFAIQHVLSRRRWVGSGDIFLGVGLGLLLGWRDLFLALFLAYMSGAIVAGALILTKRLKTSSTMPFGPYLMAAGFVAWLWSEQIINWYFGHALFM